MSRLSTKSIALASDHAGFILKEKILFYLKKLKIKTFDLGTFSEDRVDYPDNAKKHTPCAPVFSTFPASSTNCTVMVLAFSDSGGSQQ